MESSILQYTFFISVESMTGKYREAFVFNFNYIVWVNIFCHTVFCTLHIGAGEQTMF